MSLWRCKHLVSPTLFRFSLRYDNPKRSKHQQVDFRTPSRTERFACTSSTTSRVYVKLVYPVATQCWPGFCQSNNSKNSESLSPCKIEIKSWMDTRCWNDNKQLITYKNTKILLKSSTYYSVLLLVVSGSCRCNWTRADKILDVIIIWRSCEGHAKNGIIQTASSGPMTAQQRIWTPKNGWRMKRIQTNHNCTKIFIFIYT